MALLLNGKAYSIVTDQLGTPTEAYNAEGEEVWSRRLDMNGNILEENYDRYAPYSEQIRIPFLFQGQYYDHEIELAYNRFRYYSPELGRYISEDPIRFESGTTALHTYVDDSNGWFDAFGLRKTYKKHGNTKGLQRAEGYTLRDRTTGEVRKYGETTRGERKFGKGKQRRYTKKYLDDHNVDYVKETQGSKRRMHTWQHKITYKETHGGMRPLLNKSDY